MLKQSPRNHQLTRRLLSGTTLSCLAAFGASLVLGGCGGEPEPEPLVQEDPEPVVIPDPTPRVTSIADLMAQYDIDQRIQLSELGQ